jgi:hypothetical protein
MTEFCKLTTQQMTTFGGYQWRSREWNEAPSEGPLCTANWIHLYSHPLMAAAMNPIHANFRNPRLWAVEIGGKTLDDYGMKLGVQRCRLLYERPLPVISADALIRWAILCVRTSPQPQPWLDWSDRWLSGEDRSAAATWPAARAALALWSDSTTRESEASWAAEAASWAAEAAWDSVEDPLAAWEASGEAAASVVRSAEAVFASAPILLLNLLQQAIREEGR